MIARELVESLQGNLDDEVLLYDAETDDGLPLGVVTVVVPGKKVAAGPVVLYAEGHERPEEER